MCSICNNISLAKMIYPDRGHQGGGGGKKNRLRKKKIFNYLRKNIDYSCIFILMRYRS